MRFTYALAILTLLNACDRSGANQPPVLENVGFTTAEDTALDLALSISDPDGDALTIEVTQPRHGVLVGEGTAWRYTPARDFNGRDSFTVTLSDATLSVRNAVVELLVTPVNDAPSAANDAFAAREDTTLALPFSALLGNDADVDSELTITSVTGAFGGAVLLEGALVRFVPLPDFLGPAGFTYVASDGELTASAVVAITVGGENDAPVAGPDALTGVEDTALDIAAAALLANDSDVEQQTLFIASVGDAAGGTVELRGSTVHFTPTLDLNGGAGFSYTVSDGAATTTAAVTLTLAAVDDAPIATAASAVTAEDVTATIALSASDVDSSALSFSVEVPPVHGTVVIVGRDARYTPALNYAGADQFSVRVSDGHSSSAPVVIAVSVTDVIECGDGVLEGGEGCDDGNQVDSDACLHTCVAARCGDSVLQAGVETCDDGNQSNADACLTTCAAASCGDTFVQAGVETCDDGNQSNTDACLTTCAAASCGDAFVRAGVETCDDGNQSNADACLTTCAAASCGDTFVQAGVETCDDGNQSNTDACLTTCAAAGCGDTFVQAGVETCDDGNQSNADACLSTCAAASCGDAFVQTGVETCDDGNQSNADACLTTCAAASCGDTFVQTGVETCDDGNQSNTDACLTSCAPASCGDAFVQAGVEACDDGNQLETDACLTTCAAASCGDAFVRAGLEMCDDGNQSNTDACLGTCMAASCGDAFVRTGVEQCDDANQDNGDACLTTCVASSCGDGFVQAGVEQCDDANQANADACLNSCAAASCGDGFVQTGVEQCDDANQANGDACLTTCVASSCGDGFVQTGVEQCDDANQATADACLNNCAAASCGDGFVQAGVEQCDDANQANADACLNTCVASSCGDGFVQTGVEQCDDANQANGDACLNTCVASSCGDGFVQAGVEQCDDANLVDADGCSNLCVAPTCGDGVVFGTEACDDGNVADQDGCSGVCVVESCGDGAVQYGLGEICDDGNVASGDGCDALCHLEGGFSTVSPIAVSGSLSCVLSQSNTGRKVAVDSLGNIFVAMSCGGDGYVAVSTDRGVTFLPPVALGISGIDELAVAAGPPGVAYVAVSGGGTARFTRTSNAGVTWSAPIDLATAFDFEISIEAFNDDVFVGVGGGSGVLVLHNDARGVGAFTTTDVAISQAFFDLIYDDRRGALLVCSDTPDFHVRVSADRGATFGAEVNPAGMAFYSDWTVGNGTIFVAGTSGGSDQLILIPADQPATSSQVGGLPLTNMSNHRALSADVSGNAYVVTKLDTGEVQLDRLTVGAASFSPLRTITLLGNFPGVAALPTSNGAAVVYGDDLGTVYSTIQVY